MDSLANRFGLHQNSITLFCILILIIGCIQNNYLNIHQMLFCSIRTIYYMNQNLLYLAYSSIPEKLTNISTSDKFKPMKIDSNDIPIISPAHTLSYIETNTNNNFLSFNINNENLSGSLPSSPINNEIANKLQRVSSINNINDKRNTPIEISWKEREYNKFMDYSNCIIEYIIKCNKYNIKQYQINNIKDCIDILYENNNFKSNQLDAIIKQSNYNNTNNIILFRIPIPFPMDANHLFLFAILMCRPSSCIYIGASSFNLSY